MSKYIYNNIYIYIHTYFFYGPSERKDAWTCSQAGVLRVYKNSPSDSRPSGYKSLRYRLRECSLCAEGARCSGLLACVSAACVPGSTARSLRTKAWSCLPGSHCECSMRNAGLLPAHPPNPPAYQPTRSHSRCAFVKLGCMHAVMHAHLQANYSYEFHGFYEFHKHP